MRFCDKITSGGIYRGKHIVGGYRNSTRCPKFRDHVCEEIKEYMEKKGQSKKEAEVLYHFDEVDKFGIGAHQGGSQQGSSGGAMWYRFQTSYIPRDPSSSF